MKTLDQFTATVARRTFDVRVSEDEEGNPKTTIKNGTDKVSIDAHLTIVEAKLLMYGYLEGFNAGRFVEHSGYGAIKVKSDKEFKV